MQIGARDQGDTATVGVSPIAQLLPQFPLPQMHVLAISIQTLPPLHGPGACALPGRSQREPLCAPEL